MTTNTKPTTAAAITAALLLRIPHEFPARVWRRNVGVARRGMIRIRFGYPGESDIDGIIQVCGLGVRLSIEVKAGDDRQSKQQISYETMIKKFGGIYIIARDVETAMVDLRLAVVALRDNRFALTGR